MRFQEFYTDELLDCFCNPKKQPEEVFNKNLDTMCVLTQGIFWGIIYQDDNEEIVDNHMKPYYEYVRSRWPSGLNLGEIWHYLFTVRYPHNSVDTIPLEELNIDEVFAVMLYPFAGRMGGSFEEDFAYCGGLGKCLLRIKKLDSQD